MDAAGTAAESMQAAGDGGPAHGPARAKRDRRGRDGCVQRARRGRGRPRAAVNPETVESLAAILCTVEEIAAVCRCSKDTLERNFAAPIKRGREAGKVSLRRAQWKAAQKGNATMLIWLGKQYLGQKDQGPDLAGKDGVPLLTIEALDALLAAMLAERVNGAWNGGVPEDKGRWD